MAISNGKRRRKAHQARVRALATSDRFTDLMNAASSGTRSCTDCHINWAATSLNEFGRCPPCSSWLPPRQAKQRRFAGQSVQEQSNNIVYVDASFQDGVAGLAIVGALGEHTCTTVADKSTEAETMALTWATELARAASATGLTFRTDCETACRFHIPPRRNRGHGWTFELIPRRQNRAADQLAWDARLAAAA